VLLHCITAREWPDLNARSHQWRCGQQAALALRDLIGRRTVSCDQRDVDRYGRTVSR
jgi:endonuclease YncB( thermonuclease family)